MYVLYIWISTDEAVRKSLQPLRVDGGDAAGEVRLRFDHDRMRERKIRGVGIQKILHNPTAYTHLHYIRFWQHLVARQIHRTFGEAKNPLAPTSINTRLRYCEIIVSRASGKATKGMYGPKSISVAVSVNILAVMHVCMYVCMCVCM